MARPLVDALGQEVLSRRVLHTDETPVALLKPGHKKTQQAYLWAYAPGLFEDLKAVVYDFCESRAGEHARANLGNWKGALVCDDFAGYKQSFTLGLERAVAALRSDAQQVDDYLLMYLSPLGWEHVNLTGDYLWRSNTKTDGGKFRPARTLARA